MLLIVSLALPAYGVKVNLLPAHGPAKKLSLEEAILLALRYDPSIQNSEIDRISQKFALRQAANEFEVQYDLTLGYDASQTRSRGTPSGTDLSTVSPSMSLKNHYGGTYTVKLNNPTTDGVYNPGVNLSIEQPLLRGFGKAVTMTPYYNAIDTETANKLNLKSTLITQVQSIITSYRTLIQSQNNVVTSQLGVDNFAQTLRTTKALIKAGRKAPSDILQAQSDLTSQEVQLENQKNTVVTNKLTLINNIGLPPQINFKVPKDVTDMKPIKLNAKDSYHIALRNNPGYLRQILTVRQNERNLLVAQDNMRMKLDATITANTGDGGGGGPDSGFVSLTNNRNTRLGVGLLLTVPIEDFSLKSALISAQTALAQSKITLEEQRRTLMSTIINDITNIRSNYRQALLSKKSVEIAQQNQDILNAKLGLGLKTIFEVNEQMKNLIDAKNSFIASKIAYLNSVTALYVDMGILLDKYRIKVRY